MTREYQVSFTTSFNIMPFGEARGVCIRNKDIHIEMSLSNRYLIYRQIIYKFRKGVFDKFILVFFGARFFLSPMILLGLLFRYLDKRTWVLFCMSSKEFGNLCTYGKSKFSFFLLFSDATKKKITKEKLKCINN